MGSLIMQCLEKVLVFPSYIREIFRMKICDIDLYRKAPVINDMDDWYRTKCLKVPEEYVKGSVIDIQTNIFTLGALVFGQFFCF